VYTPLSCKAIFCFTNELQKGHELVPKRASTIFRCFRCLVETRHLSNAPFIQRRVHSYGPHPLMIRVSPWCFAEEGQDGDTYGQLSYQSFTSCSLCSLEKNMKDRLVSFCLLHTAAWGQETLLSYHCNSLQFYRFISEIRYVSELYE